MNGIGLLRQIVGTEGYTNFVMPSGVSQDSLPADQKYLNSVVTGFIPKSVNFVRYCAVSHVCFQTLSSGG